MQRDASTYMDRVGGKSCKILLFGDVVYNVGSLAESSIDVCRQMNLMGPSMRPVVVNTAWG